MQRLNLCSTVTGLYSYSFLTVPLKIAATTHFYLNGEAEGIFLESCGTRLWDSLFRQTTHFGFSSPHTAAQTNNSACSKHWNEAF